LCGRSRFEASSLKATVLYCLSTRLAQICKPGVPNVYLYRMLLARVSAGALNRAVAGLELFAGAAGAGGVARHAAPCFRIGRIDFVGARARGEGHAAG